LQVVDLALCAVRCAAASHQITDGDAGDQADDREQPGREGLFHESFLYINGCAYVNVSYLLCIPRREAAVTGS